ncbi:MAG: hypothetical protein ACLR17_18350 [Enterobacteriaceae bacterium]
MLIPRNFPITLRLTLYFSLAMGLGSVTGLLYSTMRNQLGRRISASYAVAAFSTGDSSHHQRQGPKDLCSRSYSSSSLVRTAVATYYQPGR